MTKTTQKIIGISSFVLLNLGIIGMAITSAIVGNDRIFMPIFSVSIVLMILGMIPLVYLYWKEI